MEQFPQQPTMQDEPADLGGDPTMGDQQGMEPGPDMEQPMDDQMAPDMEGSEGGDEILSIYNKLSDTDQKAAKGYMESLVSRDESQGNAPEAGAGEAPMDGDMGLQNEGITLTKHQVDKIYEQFGADGLDRITREPKSEKVKNLDKNSPFSAPKLN